MHNFVLLVILAGESVHHHICTLKLLVYVNLTQETSLWNYTSLCLPDCPIRWHNTVKQHKPKLLCYSKPLCYIPARCMAIRVEVVLSHDAIEAFTSRIERRYNCYCFLSFTLQFNLTSLCCTPLLDQIRVCCWAGVTTSVT